MAFTCPQHGKIHRIGSDIKHCPICGKSVYQVFIVPKIYVDKEVCWSIFGACIIIILVCLIVTGVRSCCNEQDAETAATNARIAQMDPTWHLLYVQLSKVDGDAEVDVCKQFVQNNHDYLSNHSITPDELTFILDSVGYKGDISKILSSFEKNDK